MIKHTHVIAIDWGTSHLKAHLCQVNDDLSLTAIGFKQGSGVSKVEDSFEQELSRCIFDWVGQYGKLPILMAGQIGSSIGWHQAPYLPCPASANLLANDSLKFNFEHHQVYIVPGLSCQHHDGNQDVMRSEEIQILGWLESDSRHKVGEHLLCLPGTHTKWVLVQNGNITLFKSAMTGELFDILSNHSILIQGKSSQFNQRVFDKGARYTLQSNTGNFTHGLFTVRSKQLFSEITAQEAPAYLSGLLIGSDIRAAINADEWQFDTFAQVEIIGASHLADCYKSAFSIENVSANVCSINELTVLGFSMIHQELYGG